MHADRRAVASWPDVFSKQASDVEGVKASLAGFMSLSEGYLDRASVKLTLALEEEDCGRLGLELDAVELR